MSIIENLHAVRAVNRRSFIKGGCSIAAAMSFPILGVYPQPSALTRGSRLAPGQAADVTATLSDYMSAAGQIELPKEAIEKTKQHTLDTLAAMISGVNLPPAKIALKFARAYPGEKRIPVIATDILCGPIEAALANAMLAHSDETDDSHAPSHSHPGCSVVPTALVAGLEFGISGTRFLRAVALGYDIGTRILMALGGLPFQMQTHRSAHSIASTFGASAAAGCIASLNAQQMRWLLDYAAQQASGIAAWQRDTEHIEKSLVFAGFPARNALTSALLIQSGATGVEDIFGGADNFFLAFSPTADLSQLTDQLGQRFEITRTSIKKWSVGSPIQAPLDAVQLLMIRHNLSADEIQRVNVHIATSEAKTVNDREMPDISLQHMVAVMMLDKTISFEAAHNKSRMANAAVLQQKAKVTLIPDADLERLYPKRITIVEMTVKDGTRLTERVEAVRGTPDNPMSTDEVTTKARDLMQPYLGSQQIEDLISTVFNLEKVQDLRTLRPLLRSAYNGATS